MKQVIDALDVKLKSIDNIFQASRDGAFWALKNLDIDPYDNQIEIINDVCDLSITYLAILQARGAGKTFAVGLGLVKLCLDIPGLAIGIFGPKAEQANRIIKEITTKIITPKSPIFNEVKWSKSSNSRLVFANGSEMHAISASEQAMQEGTHFNIVVLDECHQISDISVNQRIIPMLGSLPIGKIIKLGISMYRQNFWKSCCGLNTQYKVLQRDWTKCRILCVSKGSFLYKGEELPRYALDQMPLSMKQKMFPDRPDLHYDGNMTELDFRTQYSMEWLQEVNLVLTEEDQKKLISGTHDILQKGRPEFQETYFFGLDTASGTPSTNTKGLDYTALSIWRKRGDHIKEKVKCYEWQGSVLDQMEEIKQIIHLITGIFPCTFGCADHSNIAIGIIETFQREGFPIEGIQFGRTEEMSKKNYKNAMFDQFVFELQSDRIKFPSLDKLDTDACMKKSFNEWCAIERAKKLGINDSIQAPAVFDAHDDHCCADVLAIWAMDKNDSFKTVGQRYVKLPNPSIGNFSIASRGIVIPTAPNQNRYLK